MRGRAGPTNLGAGNGVRPRKSSRSIVRAAMVPRLRLRPRCRSSRPTICAVLRKPIRRARFTRKVALRIDDPQSPMPPTSTGDTLTVQEKGAIKSWIDGGAVASDNASCNLMVSPDGGNAGTTGEFTWPADCEQRYKILAHGKSDPKDTTKYNVSAQGLGKQWYQCFFFKPPWGNDKVQVLAFRPIIDNPKVIHHWIMYGNEDGKQADGTVGGQGCNVGAFLQGWAPGSQGSGDLPSDVGLQMPSGPNVVLGLEVHYNNTANVPDAMDASGVEVLHHQEVSPQERGRPLARNDGPHPTAAADEQLYQHLHSNQHRTGAHPFDEPSHAPARNACDAGLESEEWRQRNADRQALQFCRPRRLPIGDDSQSWRFAHEQLHIQQHHAQSRDVRREHGKRDVLLVYNSLSRWRSHHGGARVGPQPMHQRLLTPLVALWAPFVGRPK